MQDYGKVNSGSTHGDDLENIINDDPAYSGEEEDSYCNDNDIDDIDDDDFYGESFSSEYSTNSIPADTSNIERLECCIVSGRDLGCAEKNGLCDAFVILRLLDASNDVILEKKSSVIQNTPDPHFNFHGDFEDDIDAMTLGKACLLKMEVWDKDYRQMNGDIYIGSLTFKLRAGNHEIAQTTPLKAGKGREPKGKLTFRLAWTRPWSEQSSAEAVETHPNSSPYSQQKTKNLTTPSRRARSASAYKRSFPGTSQSGAQQVKPKTNTVAQDYIDILSSSFPGASRSDTVHSHPGRQPRPPSAGPTRGVGNHLHLRKTGHAGVHRPSSASPARASREAHSKPVPPTRPKTAQLQPAARQSSQSKPQRFVQSARQARDSSVKTVYTGAVLTDGVQEIMRQKQAEQRRLVPAQRTKDDALTRMAVSMS